MIAVIFRFDLKVRSKKVKIGQFSKFEILKIKHTFLIKFHLRNPTVQFVFVCDVYKWPKNVIQFYDVTTFHTYYSHLGVKNWDRNLKFGMWSTLMWFLYI